MHLNTTNLSSNYKTYELKDIQDELLEADSSEWSLVHHAVATALDQMIQIIQAFIEKESDLPRSLDACLKDEFYRNKLPS